MEQLKYYQQIAAVLNISVNQVSQTAELLNGGATVPFIARYRKEVTGNLDEVQITSIRDLLSELIEMDKRRATILKTIAEQGKLTPELEKKINNAPSLSVLEDLYLPYKPKRRTKATIAKEKGLEPLAELIFKQTAIDVTSEASNFVDAAKEVNTSDEAIQGAKDIIAEWISEDADIRKSLRILYEKEAWIDSKVITGKEEEGEKYKDYFEFNQLLKDIPSHRLLALRRGEKEGFLRLDIAPENESATELIKNKVVTSKTEASKIVASAADESYKRLIKPSMETEFRLTSKKTADEQAIKVFADNVRELLLASPLGQKAILALDPGFRTGCKIVCLDPQGKLLHNTTIYPHEPQKQVIEATKTIQQLISAFQIEAIAIGNGTAGRESENFIKSIGLPTTIPVIVVNESGASIYSASEVARKEFPDHDVTVRGAVSIGRRLADPLAELVKIDPKSIGVGQYQHDVDQTALKKSLDDTVMSCVNAVGVDLNTASSELLSYVSGLGPILAKNIVDYRNANGAFTARKNLLEVPRMGAKAFEQCAGFLRIRNASNPLDASAVHPESYTIVEQMAKDLNTSVAQLITDEKIRKQIDIKKYVTNEIGLPTLQDILAELEKPGRDPREPFEIFSFAEGVNEISDLRVGMELPGIVTNVTKFGAFVDIGVHQDGLVHISELSDTFISDPAAIVKVQQKVTVKVIEVDASRKRISLSMKSGQKAAPKKGNNKKAEPVEGDLQSKLSQLKSMFK